MRILITNDDGIHAPGLAVLERIAKTLSDDIFIVAPESDQSGVSHSLTINDPLRLRKISGRHFAVKGTPTDCVIMGVRRLLDGVKPDLVLSGVNNGQNVAEDLTYSGTVAGALEGANLGLPSIALSQAYGAGRARRAFWTAPKPMRPICIRKIIAEGIPQGLIINVNFPACRAVEVQGVAVTRKAGATCKQSPSRSARMGAQSLLLDYCCPAKIRPPCMAPTSRPWRKTSFR